MNKDCGFYTAKYTLCLCNFIFFVLGTIFLAIGIWLSVDKASLIALLKMVENEHLEQFSQPELIEQMAYVIIGFSAIMFFLSFLGYCGALRESRCFLIAYGVFMILLLCAQLAALSVGSFYKNEVRTETKNFLSSTITRYYSSNEQNDAVTLMWNRMMTSFSCCGVNNYTDFEKSVSWVANKGNRTVPEACCILQDTTPRDENCPSSPNESNSYYEKGCFNAFTDWLILHREIIIGVLLAVDIAHLFAIFLAFCICKALTRVHRLRL